MRKHAATAGAILIAAMLWSCAHVQRSYAGQTIIHTSVIRIWAQDDPLLPMRAVLDGCRFWEPKGVLCVLVSKPEHATVRIYTNPVACGKGESKIEPREPLPPVPGCVEPTPATSSGYALAEAWHDEGKIVVFTSCTSPSGQLNQQELTLTVAHEFGHQIGIWVHVPTVCDVCGQETKVHPSGRKICGEGALMNSSHHSGLEFMTEIDSMAFDVRDKNESVLESLVPLFSALRPAKKVKPIPPTQHRP